MLELSEANVVGYLRGAGRISGEGEVLVQALSGGIANVVLKVFDVGARGGMGECVVVKQPLGRFRTAAEWVVDIGRVKVERDCMGLLGELLPAGSVPGVLWFDEENYVLGMTAAPTGAVLWKKALLAGEIQMEAATHAGMLMAMLHSPTVDDRAVRERYGDATFFRQQRVEPYFYATAEKHPAVAGLLKSLGERMAGFGMCLIHGDFSPKNIFLIPMAKAALGLGGTDERVEIERLMLLDFEVAFYGHPAFDVATLINHFLLKGFYHGKKWRGFMGLADNFWQTYRHTAEPGLVRAASAVGGHVLGALLLARVDGKSPAEYLNEEVRGQARAAALRLLGQGDAGLDHALDSVAMSFSPAE